MRNTPLRAFAKKSPVRRATEAVVESTATPKVQPVKIKPEKTETYNPGKDAPKDPGKIYDKTAQQRKAIQQANPLATLFTGRKTKS